jgi:hypothetical protein
VERRKEDILAGSGPFIPSLGNPVFPQCRSNKNRTIGIDNSNPDATYEQKLAELDIYDVDARKTIYDLKNYILN